MIEKTTTKIKKFSNGVEAYIIDMESLDLELIAKIIVLHNQKNISSLYYDNKDDIINIYKYVEMDNVLEWASNYNEYGIRVVGELSSREYSQQNKELSHNIIYDLTVDIKDRRGLKKVWSMMEEEIGISKIKLRLEEGIKQVLNSYEKNTELSKIYRKIEQKVEEELLKFDLFKKEWDKIDDDILKGIKSDWTNIIVNNMLAFGY